MVLSETKSNQWKQEKHINRIGGVIKLAIGFILTFIIVILFILGLTLNTSWMVLASGLLTLPSVMLMIAGWLKLFKRNYH